MSLGSHIVACGLASLLSGCYTWSQALHQNDVFNTRRELRAVLEDPTTTVQLKAQLAKVADIIDFAKQQGLNTAGAYGYLIQTKDPVVSYLVQAAHPDRLEFVTWWFPVVGSVPYLGYVRKDERDQEAARLRAAGFDVTTGGAGAFSSLGWFDDPIFSSMLERGDADLANLFFHELTHRTLWIPGSPAFNENLAEYIALVLTRRYFDAQGGPESAAVLRRFKLKQDDKMLFTDWLTKLKQELTTLYASTPGKAAPALMQQKKQLFERFTSYPLKPKFALVDFVGAESWNNAAVLSAALYAPDHERFATSHACFGRRRPIIEFLEALKDAAVVGDEPFSRLDQFCSPEVLEGAQRVD